MNLNLRDIPFSSVMGLERAALALQLVMTDDCLRGVLLSGTKGTGKSVLAAGTRFIHPELDQDDALLRVPMGVTERNLMGGLDMARMLETGEAVLQPGLLKKADGRILLIDNINLLTDRLLDLVLDSAASGILTVENEGISYSTESRFKLIATMDPDEGRLRPQMLDRFDLSVETGSLGSATERKDLLLRLLSLGSGNTRYLNHFRSEDAKARDNVRKARRRLSRVGIKVRALTAIVFAMTVLEVDGQRPELVLTKASGALASLRCRTKVIWDDLRDVAPMVLGHRTRKGGSEGPPDEKTVITVLKQGWAIGSRYAAANTLLMLRDAKNSLFDAILAGMESASDSPEKWSSETRRLKEKEYMFESRFPDFMKGTVLKQLTEKIARTAVMGIGSKHTITKPSTEHDRGKRVRVVPTDDPWKMDIFQTVLSAVIQGHKLPLFPLGRNCWRTWERSSRPRAIVMVIVDASKSSRGYLFGLSELLKTMFEEYFDPLSKIGLISMNRGRPVLHFKPTRNRLRVYGRMKELTSSGYTPLAGALEIARKTLQRSNTTGDLRGNFILLVSDCAPEPLPLGCRDPFGSDLYGRVKKQAKMCGMSGIPVLVIDPLNYPNLKSPEEMPGRRLARYIEKVTAGMFIHIPASVLDSQKKVIRVFNSIANRSEIVRVRGQLDEEIAHYSSVNSYPWLRG